MKKLTSEFRLAGRKSGITTRLIDESIQWLFDNPGNTLIVFDHHDSYLAREDMFRRIGRRMAIEHPHAFKNLVVNNERLTIMLKPEDEWE